VKVASAIRVFVLIWIGVGLVLGVVGRSVAQSSSAPGAVSPLNPGQPQTAPTVRPGQTVPIVRPGQTVPSTTVPSPLTPPVEMPAPPGQPPAGTAPPTGVVPQPTPESSEAVPEEQPAATEPAAEGLPAVPAALSPIERLLAGQTPQPERFLRQFGYDLFRQAPTTFAPVTNVPVGPDYVIGPGDSLNIVLWGGVQAAYQVTVDRNGAITVPRLGVVQVWGLTLEQLRPFLRQRFEEFYPDFQMAVTLGELRTIRVFVVGEVRQPGAYTVSSLSTIINALFASGGPTKNGTLRHIQLVRRGAVVHRLDLYNFLLRGDKSQDRTLQSGDTIFVPVIGPVAGVAGNVKRPAIYEITPRTTLQGLLHLAGGVTPIGYLQRLQVERIIANEKKIVVDLDLSVSRHDRRWQTPITDGDLVQVFAIVPTLENVVQLEGHVVRPGRYELKPGMRLHDLVTSYDDLLPEPYLAYADIVRLVEPDLHREIIPFNLGALLAGDPAQNLVLHPQDMVRIYSQETFVDRPVATVQGEVRQPGMYPLLGGMRVRDLVFRAGGLKRLAYLVKAELTRHTISQGGDVVERLEIDLGRAMSGDPEHNVVVEDLDQLVVRRIPDINLQRTVEILGEVRFPGTYPIQKGERLSSVLRRAGGFTVEAYLRGAVFTRQSAKAEQQKRLQELIREEEQALLAVSAAEAETALSTEEVAGRRQALEARRQLLERLRAIEPDGRVVVRLRPLEAFTGSAQDIALETGDRLMIPETPKYVNVVGEVYNRTALIYESGNDIAHYLEKVGGLKPQANEKEVYLVQVDGTVMSNTQDQFVILQADGRTTYVGDFFAVEPQPGDTIVVPRKVKTPATLRNTRDIVQIVFQTLSSVGVVLGLIL
jgi:polysaccharide export outer membrane protein